MFDHRMSAVFARQHGLATRAQAFAAGGTREMVQHRVEVRRWVRVAAGVYRLAGMPVTWEQRALAACLVAGPAATVSHRSAAVLLKISGFRPGPVEITVPPGASARNRVARVHRAPLRPVDRTVREHIAVTSPGRTLGDLARLVTPGLLAEAVDDVLCRRLATLDDLAARPALRTVLAAWNGDATLPGSPAELALVRAMRAAGLPDPIRQHWIAAAHARVDLAYPAERIAIELDSFRWHAGRRPFERERARGNRIVAAGWQLLRATPGDTATAVNAAGRLLRRIA